MKQMLANENLLEKLYSIMLEIRYAILPEEDLPSDELSEISKEIAQIKSGNTSDYELI